LPAHSAEFVKISNSDPNAALVADSYDLGLVNELERQVATKLQQTNVPFKILILEDEAIYRNFVVGIIQKLVLLAPHVEVTALAKVTEATSYFQDHTPQLLILDIGLEGSNGLEFLKVIRSQGYKGKVCVHSNRNSVEDLRASLAAGADAVIPKPLAVGQLLGLV
jgi:DNA-binding response OmpR family regulator